MHYFIEYSLIGIACICGYMCLLLLHTYLTSRPKIKQDIAENPYIKRHLDMLKRKKYYSVPRPEEEQPDNIKNFSRSIKEFDRQMGYNLWEDEE
ncbi:MAG: hypothetical protein V4581_01205 [Bacteroidota bacterium]